MVKVIGVIAGILALAGSIYGVIELYEWLSKRRRSARLATLRRQQSATPAGPLRLLNFAHPITSEQKKAVENYLQVTVDEIVDRPLHLDHVEAFEDQVRRAVDSVPLASAEWQASDFVVNLPGFAPAAVVLLTELHGRMGHFPTVIRLRPVPDSSPQAYELAEIINLQAVRDAARRRR